MRNNGSGVRMCSVHRCDGREERHEFIQHITGKLSYPGIGDIEYIAAMPAAGGGFQRQPGIGHQAGIGMAGHINFRHEHDALARSVGNQLAHLFLCVVAAVALGKMAADFMLAPNPIGR